MKGQISLIPGYEYEPPEPKRGAPKYQKPQELYGPGPEGTTCKGCVHCLKIRYHDKIYYKCAEWIMSHSEATDVRLKWGSCSKFEAKPGYKPDRISLYWVTVGKAESGLYVFARSSARARYMATNAAITSAFTDYSYTDARAFMMRPEAGGPEQVVECQDDSGYDRVTALGCRFNDWEDML